MITKDRDRGPETPELDIFSQKVAGIMVEMEMGALYGFYEKALQLPRISELRNSLSQEFAERLDNLMEVYNDAKGHAGLMLIAQRMWYNNLPVDSVGECTQTLYLLSVGVGVHKEPKVAIETQLNYAQQCVQFANKIGKQPSLLTFADLGKAILSGEFDLRPEVTTG